jgi:ATP-dependent Clp protease ATP-binding subunit ClpC
MPKINVYLPDDLADAVKEAAVPVSAICQRALEQAVRRSALMREAADELLSIDPDGDDDPHGINLTRRTLAIVQLAAEHASALAAAQIETEHLLSALLAEGNGLAVRVLRSLEVETRQVQAALARSGHGGQQDAADGGELKFSAQSRAALQLAVTESAALGSDYVGTEHLLLGLIAEPDGMAGQVLRSLGADQRYTRRAVAATLAGWAAGRERGMAGPAAAGPAGRTGPAAGATGPAAAGLSAAIRGELEPVLRRLDLLEQRLGSGPAAV